MFELSPTQVKETETAPVVRRRRGRPPKRTPIDTQTMMISPQVSLPPSESHLQNHSFSTFQTLPVSQTPKLYQGHYAAASIVEQQSFRGQGAIQLQSGHISGMVPSGYSSVSTSPTDKPSSTMAACKAAAEIASYMQASPSSVRDISTPPSLSPKTEIEMPISTLSSLDTLVDPSAFYQKKPISTWKLDNQRQEDQHIYHDPSQFQEYWPMYPVANISQQPESCHGAGIMRTTSATTTTTSAAFSSSAAESTLLTPPMKTTTVSGLTASTSLTSLHQSPGSIGVSASSGSVCFDGYTLGSSSPVRSEPSRSVIERRFSNGISPSRRLTVQTFNRRLSAAVDSGSTTPTSSSYSPQRSNIKMALASNDQGQAVIQPGCEDFQRPSKMRRSSHAYDCSMERRASTSGALYSADEEHFTINGMDSTNASYHYGAAVHEEVDSSNNISARRNSLESLFPELMVRLAATNSLITPSSPPDDLMTDSNSMLNIAPAYLERLGHSINMDGDGDARLALKRLLSRSASSPASPAGQQQTPLGIY